MDAAVLVLAHGVGRVYELPVPLGFYLGGAALTVVVTFLLRAFTRTDRELSEPRRVAGPRAAHFVSAALQIGAATFVLLAIVAAIVTRDRGLTASTLVFWVLLVVGFAFLSALLGGAWAVADPWSTFQRIYLPGSLGRPSQDPPWWLGPATLYALFWFELVSGRGFEDSAGVFALMAYSLYTLSIRAPFGDNFKLADPFHILFGFASRIAPFELSREQISFKGFVRGLVEDRPMPVALFVSLFVLLGSTTLDNVRETVGWTDLRAALGLASTSDLVVDSVALVLFAGLFFSLLASVVRLASRWVTDRPFIELARLFAWSLVPIGVTYLLAHNVPLMMTGFPQLLAAVSDPFLRDWNLFGTASLVVRPSPELVWFIEIGLIVGGHVLAVLAGHRIAVRLAPSRRAAMRSQYALTALMATLTITTLWLLAQPLVTR